MNAREVRARLAALLEAHHPEPGSQPSRRALPSSRAAMVATFAAQVAGLVALVVVTTQAVRPILSEPGPARVRAEGPGDQRFELPEKDRRAIFAELAAAELAERKRHVDGNTWQGHPWSREDDRGWQEHTLVRSLASRHGVSMSQIYLVLDEGIHAKWPGPDGKPLPATAEPLNMRTGW